MRFEWVDVEIALFTGLAVLTVLAVIVLFRNERATRLVRRRLRCPVEGTPATVDFVVAADDDGEAYLDVAKCSLIPPGEPVDCGKVRRSASVAPFADPRQPSS